MIKKTNVLITSSIANIYDKNIAKMYAYRDAYVEVELHKKKGEVLLDIQEAVMPDIKRFGHIKISLLLTFGKYMKEVK